jgi:hypothetical protein
MKSILLFKITLSTIIFSGLSQLANAEPSKNSPTLAQVSSLPAKNPCIFQSNPTVDVSKAINSLKPDPKNKPSGWTTVEFYSPTSPAAKLIGSDPDGKIQSISTPNDLSAKLLTGLNADGEFAPGLSVELLPYVLIREKGLSLSEYRSSEFQRFLANTKLSIATNKATDNTGTARVGVGVEFVLQNDGDLRKNEQLFQCIEKIIADTKGDPDMIAADREKLLAEREPRFLAAKTAAVADGNKGTMWIAAIGSSWLSPTGKYGDLRGEGIGMWTTYKKGLGTNSQLLVHGAYRTNERISNRQNGFVNADTLLGGVRFLAGDPNLRFSVETAYNHESQAGKPSNDYLSYGIGLEPKVGQDLWLSLYLGGTSGRQNGSDFQLTTGVKWNFNTGYQTLEDLQPKDK